MSTTILNDFDIDQDDFSATYSPEDNKLRFTASYFFEKDLFNLVRQIGFKHAPKQELFYAHWTPSREDFLLELCGSIGDEDTSLVDRAEQRAERFEGYSVNRAKDAESAFKSVKAISDNIPFGQPILVGHHSEKRARKDAERIEKGMQKTVKMWETSEYWTHRANGAIRAAKYKEKPDVRARRIKKIEAENRKYTKYCEEAEILIKLWSSDNLNHEKTLHICNYLDHFSMCFTLEKYPRDETASQYEGAMSLYSALTEGVISFEQARDLSLPSKNHTIEWYTRWINHNNNRLAYEKAMLEDQGGSALLEKKPRPKQPPLLNYHCPEGLNIENEYNRGSFIHYSQVEMTKAEYSKIPSNYKGGQKYKGHRVRIALNVYASPKGDMDHRHSYSIVFLTDSKEHARPEAE